MFSYVRSICLALSLLTTAGLHFASAQDYDWSDEDLPEWLEDLGYEDADYDRPVTDSVFEPGDGARGMSSAGGVGQTTPTPTPNPYGSCCDCLMCRPTLTGDWHGRRLCLQQRGFIYRARVTQFFFGVAGGIEEPVPAPFAALGIAGGDTFEYTGNSQHDFLFDLEKCGGPKASRFVVTLENIWGRWANVSLETGATAPPTFNALFPVDPAANGVPRVTNFLYVQPVSERLILSVGKARLVGTADRNIFAGGDGSDQFLNQTFIANPLFIQQLVLSTFAVGAVMPQEWGNIAISVIDPVERSTDFFDLGDLFANGMLLLGQIRVNTNFFDKPGEHHIGGIYKNVDLLDLTFTPVPPTYPYPPAPPGTPKFFTNPETYTIFYGFDQYIGVFGAPDARGGAPGWGFFGRAGISDDGSGNPNFKGWHVSGGIGGDSLLRHRRDKGDRFGIAYGFTGSATAWGPLPRTLFGPRDSQAFEAYYRYHVTPAISISPNLQWVRGSLGGLTDGDDAFVYGFRMNMKL
jgi:porin